MQNNEDDHDAALPSLSVDAVIARLSVFTEEQRSLAWSPQPPFQSTGGSDCRMGGSCGLNFNRETPRARWIQARYRWNREQKKLPAPHPAGPDIPGRPKGPEP